MVGRKILAARRNQSKGQPTSRKAKDHKGMARWSKGQSCVSNPTTTKHRDRASSMFLHPVAGKSLLTVKNLNNARGNYSDGESDDDTVMSLDVASLTISDSPLSIASSVSSVRSLASGWSQLSHNAFEKFLRKFKGDFSVHKDMLSIIGAASEVINDAGGKKNETEFFATFMSLLDSCPPDQYQPVMSLVCIIIGKVSPGVLNLRFTDIYPKVGLILSHAVENDDDLLIRTSLEAFTKLMKIQNAIILEEDKSLEGVFYLALKCSLHSKPRIRRKARQCIKSMVLAHNEKQNSMTIPKIVLGWILDQLECYPTCDSKTVADSLTLLASCWTTIQRMSYTGAKKLFEKVLEVMSRGDTSILKIGYSFFTIVFQNTTALLESDPDDKLIAGVTVAVWKLQPDWRNTDTFMVWLSCVLVGMVRSHEHNSKVNCAFIPALFEILHPIWITNHGKEVLRVLNDFLPHILTKDTEESVINSCFQTIAKSYLIIPPNPNVLQATECILESLTPDNFTSSVKEVFLQLAPLKEAPGVNATLGKFIKSFGVESLWPSVKGHIRQEVILPLLHEHLHNAKISFWTSEIQTSFSKGNFGPLVKEDTIWQAFIGFCRNPKDPENFPAKMVGMVIAEKPHLRLSALSALRQLIDWAQCKSVAIKYSKNYLPLLFNLYIQEKANDESTKGYADAIGVTIQKYISVCEPLLIKELLHSALTKLEAAKEEKDEEREQNKKKGKEDAENQEKKRRPLYDLIAFISVCLTESELQAEVLEVMGKSFEYPLERKRIYRVMAALARNKDISEENLSHIKTMLKSKGESGKTKSNAAAIRLECINIVTEKKPEWLREFLLEVVLNLISVNAKAKRCANKFVVYYCSCLKAENKSVEEVIDVILAGLQSTSSLLKSSTIYFTFLVYKELKPASVNKDIVNGCITQLHNSEDPIVWKYCLSYLNLCLSIYQGGMGPYASLIGAIIAEKKYPRKEINKLLARMIKVFGSAGLKAVLPNSDDPKMSVRIKNLCQKLRKLKEEKNKGKTKKEDDESEDENEDDFGYEKADVKTPVIIKEGLVDFLDPKEITRAYVSDRKPSNPEDDFKLTKSGKLIIGNVGDDDDDDDDDNSIDGDDIPDDPPRKRKYPASVASTKRSVKTNKSSFSMKSNNSSRKRKGGAAGSRSDIREKSDNSKSKKFKSSSSASSKTSSFKFRK